MSLLTTEILPFETEAYHEGAFKKVTDADLKGHWSVVFFYPADFTFVCPTELEDLADHYAEFKKLGVEIYAVSTDTHFTHKAWHESSAAVGKVQFPMLGDKTGQISRNFDVLIEKEGLAERGTFVINPAGKIVVMEHHDGGIGRDASELLRKVEAAQYVDAHPDQVCPAKWRPGKETLVPSFDLVGNAKACIDRGMQMDMDDAIAVENELFAMCFATHDQKEGMGAFLEKRPAQFNKYPDKENNAMMTAKEYIDSLRKLNTRVYMFGEKLDKPGGSPHDWPLDQLWL